MDASDSNLPADRARGSAEHHTARGKMYMTMCTCAYTHMHAYISFLVRMQATLFNHRNFILTALSKPKNLPPLLILDMLARQLDCFYPHSGDGNYNTTEWARIQV